MWCDNCLLIFPLRAGGLALLALIAAYHIAGGVFLFMYGQLFYFIQFEPQIYGGIAMAIAAVMLIAMIGFSNSSYFIVRISFVLLPIIVLVAALRGGFMIFEMQYRDDRIQWECDNAGQQWNQTNIDLGLTFTAETATGTLLPRKFCDIGVHQTYLVFTFSLLVDMVLLLYAFFLDWRMLARIRHAYELVNIKNAGPYGYA